jgi:hypothetical protein
MFTYSYCSVNAADCNYAENLHSSLSQKHGTMLCGNFKGLTHHDSLVNAADVLYSQIINSTRAYSFCLYVDFLSS